MKKLSTIKMNEISGGSRATAIIGGVTCVALVGFGAMFTWGLSIAILGPSCVGMIIGTVVD